MRARVKTGGHGLGDADAGEHQLATTLAGQIIGGSLAAT